MTKILEIIFWSALLVSSVLGIVKTLKGRNKK